MNQTRSICLKTNKKTCLNTLTQNPLSLETLSHVLGPLWAYP